MERVYTWGFRLFAVLVGVSVAREEWTAAFACAFVTLCLCAAAAVARSSPAVESDGGAG